MELGGQRPREPLIWVQIRRRLDVVQQLHTRAEEPGAERNGATGLDPVGILTEEVEVEAEVEDAEVLLVVIPVRTAPGTGACEEGRL